MNRSKKVKGQSLQQLRQRELSWALYVASGGAANLAHCVRVNAIVLSQKEKERINKTVVQLDQLCNYLRVHLGGKPQ